MVKVNSTEVIISNGSPHPIFHSIFPTEFLSRIEWGPCENPAECPEMRIDPGGIKRHDLNPLAFDDSKTFTVFWWHISDPEVGLIFSSFDMDTMEVKFPTRVLCK